MKPLLIWDIDGVLAPFGGEHGRNADYIRVDVTSGMLETYVFVRRDLPEVMKRLMQSFEIMWGTMWEESANEYREHFGFVEPLEYIKFARHWNPRHDTYKLASLMELLDENERPALWIDDEIGQDAFDYAKKRTEAGIPTLFIRTEPHIGFIDDHISEMETWAKEHST
jgi:hypothetical protein